MPWASSVPPETLVFTSMGPGNLSIKARLDFPRAVVPPGTLVRGVVPRGAPADGRLGHPPRSPGRRGAYAPIRGRHAERGARRSPAEPQPGLESRPPRPQPAWLRQESRPLPFHPTRRPQAPETRPAERSRFDWPAHLLLLMLFLLLEWESWIKERPGRPFPLASPGAFWRRKIWSWHCGLVATLAWSCPGVN